MNTEQSNNNSNIYDIYTRKFSNNSNIITDPVTEQQLKNFGKGVIDLNKRLQRIVDLRQKFGFVQNDNSKAYYSKLTQPQRTKNKLRELTRKAKLLSAIAALNNVDDGVLA